MNKQITDYDSYPWTTPFLENVLWLVVYLLGSVIFSLLSIWAAAGYFGYCMASMYLLIPRYVCTHCSYYGKTCHSGQGRIAALLFSTRGTGRFDQHFKCMRFAAPVFLAPLVAALILFFLHFSWEPLALAIGFGILALCCTRMVTTKLGCPHCKQKAVCPACRNIQTQK